MARIAFHPLGHWGHILPTFQLARGLVKRGHSVHYFALAGFEQAVTSRGFGYTRILEDVVPSGTLASTSSDPMAHGKRTPMDRRKGVIRATGEGAIDETLLAHRPDLLLVDAFAIVAALRAQRLGIPLAFVNPSFPLRRERGVPPPTSALGPPRTIVDHLRIAREWAKLRIQRFVTERDGLSAYMYRAAHDFATPAQRALLDNDTAIAPCLDGIPELVLCPAELDFPRPTRAGRTYVNAQVELDRADAPAFDWHRIAGWDHIIYASHGSMTHAYPTEAGYFQQVIDGVMRRPERQLVLSIGDLPEPHGLRYDERRVVLVRWAPQAELLKRTAIAITHGGLGTLKECITLAVPMVVLPVTFEQPGNAARVAYHGLGVIGDPARIDAATIDRLLQRIESDAGFRTRIAKMAEIFCRAERDELALCTVEQLLERLP